MRMMTIGVEEGGRGVADDDAQRHLRQEGRLRQLLGAALSDQGQLPASHVLRERLAASCRGPVSA